MPPPKKREREVETNNTKQNGHQQEQELFLQAFEKPTQIYRFLRNRHGTSPIFLNRTLSYMKDRMSRNNKKRTAFKINSILETITKKSDTATNNYLNIVFNGLFDKSNNSDEWWHAGDVVCVESTLYKITKSKRKDSTSDFQEVLSNTSNVIYNPHEDISKLTAISIPVQAMKPFGEQHTIYKLLFRINVLPKYTVKAELTNGDTEIVPPSKRSKPNPKTLGCELIVFEKNIGCIPEGDYEAALPELASTSIKAFSPKKKTWESLPDSYIPVALKFDVFNQCPTLKFRLTWSPNTIPTSIELKEFQHFGCFSDTQHAAAGGGGADNNNGTDTQINHNNNCIKTNSNANGVGLAVVSAKAEKIQIVYNFLYSNNTRQQTEYTQEVVCPWCGLDCLRLYALLKHLKLCHARFNFTYKPAGSGARIDVTINDAYDGSYAGSPYDLAGPSGCSFARTCGPVRRTTVTNLLVCRPRRQKTCLDEFLELDEDDLSNQRPYITGHNRLYHHTETCLPVHPKELDIDSEGESDPLWLRQKTIQMIDEFSDVNEGEKELMKLWNLHVMKHGYVGDCQLPIACEMFLDANGHEIIRKNLYRNFILHMCSLFDYGLVAPETVYKTVQKLQGMLSKYAEGQQLMSEQRAAQLKYWLAVGIHRQDEQKLKSPLKQTVAVVTASAAIAAIADLKAMHPPAKRTAAATPVKRAGISSSYNGTNGAASSFVAGKTAAHADEGRSNGIKQKAAATAEKEKNSTKNAATATAADKNKETSEATNNNGSSSAAKPSLKRRLSSLKDSTTTATTASKRNSSSNSNTNASNSSSGAGGNNSTTRSLAAQKNNEALSKRLVTRRQSIAVTNATTNCTPANSDSLRKNALRTRLSVPLTKVDKR